MEDKRKWNWPSSVPGRKWMFAFLLSIRQLLVNGPLLWDLRWSRNISKQINVLMWIKTYHLSVCAEDGNFVCLFFQLIRAYKNPLLSCCCSINFESFMSYCYHRSSKEIWPCTWLLPLYLKHILWCENLIFLSPTQLYSWILSIIRVNSCLSKPRRPKLSEIENTQGVISPTFSEND